MRATQEQWSRYDRWNAAIAHEFFAGRYGGRPVYLDLEDAALTRIAADAGESTSDPSATLVEVLRPTLYLRQRLSVFSDHRLRLRQWLMNPTGPPPVLAVLALLSLVAEQMKTDEDFRASNYYGRFVRTLGADVHDRQTRDKVVRCFGRSLTLSGARSTSGCSKTLVDVATQRHSPLITGSTSVPPCRRRSCAHTIGQCWRRCSSTSASLRDTRCRTRTWSGC